MGKAVRTEWRGDLLQGVKVNKGEWADGTPLIAIPNYARNNRLSEQTRNDRDSIGGDSSVNYAPGSANPNTNAPAAGANRPRGRFGESGSQVWIKAE